MKKTFKMQDLDCANCANKMENNIKKLPGVIACSISFMTQRITIEAPDDIFDEVVAKASRECGKVDKECCILY